MTRIHPRWALLWLWTMIAVLIAVMMEQTHGGSWQSAVTTACRLVLVAASLGWVAHHFCLRYPWPHPFRTSFLVLHLVASATYASVFVLLNLTVVSITHQRLVMTLGPSLMSHFALGAWLYLIVAASSYAERASARAAALEAEAAKAQLAALRAQLHPHFLFNALHTVVQLIETDGKAAVRAAEQLADVLREAIDETRMQRPLRSELAFVTRYLDLESLRFGARLRFASSCPDALLEALVPTSCIQTLVENAVRHGAAPAITTTTLTLTITPQAESLLIRLDDDGVGCDLATAPAKGGLARLQEQLRALHGSAASLHWRSQPGRGFSATLTLPRIFEADPA